jgi:hypothetical protein
MFDARLCDAWQSSKNLFFCHFVSDLMPFFTFTKNKFNFLFADDFIMLTFAAPNTSVFSPQVAKLFW